MPTQTWPWGQSWNWGQNWPSWSQSWPTTWGQGWPSWGQQWPSWDQSWSNWGQQWPNWGQQWSNLGQQWPSWGQQLPNWGQSWPNWGQSWQNWGQSWPNWAQSWSTDGSAPSYQPNIPPLGPPALPSPTPSPTPSTTPSPTTDPRPTPPSPVDFQMGGEPPIGRIAPGGISQGKLFPGGISEGELFPDGEIFPGIILPGGSDLPKPVGTWSDFIKAASESGRAEAPRSVASLSRKPAPAGFQSTATSTGKLNPAIMSYITQSKAPRPLWWAIWYCLRTDNMFSAPCECLWAQLNECYMTNTPHSLCKCANRCKWWRWDWWGWDRPGTVAAYSPASSEK